MVNIEKATKTIRVGELRFPVFDQGTGPAVLLLHGFPDSRHLWRFQIPALLDANFRALAPDLRGFGDAPKPREVEGYAIPNVMREVLGLLDTLEVDGFYLVGHDWGAVVAWFIAAYRPERVKKLVALSVGCPGNSGATSYEQLSRSWYAFLFAKAEHVSLGTWLLILIIFNGLSLVIDLIDVGRFLAGDRTPTFTLKTV